MKRILSVTIVLFSLTVVALPRPAVSQVPATTVPAYTFVDLSASAGTSFSATGISNTGYVSGTVVTDMQRACRLRPDGVREILAAPSGSYSYAGYRVNNSGQVCGTTQNNSGQNAIVWPNPSTAKKLSANPSYANAINNLGDVTGQASVKAGALPYLWEATSGKYTAVQIPLPSGCTTGAGNAVNDNQQVVGWAARNNLAQPFTWSAATGSTLLPAPSGVAAVSGQAFAINGNGWIVGNVNDSGNTSYPVIWSGGIATSCLQSGYTGGSFSALNSLSTVVGYATRAADGVQVAVLWNGTQLVDLNTVTTGMPAGAVLTSAVGINDNGAIVGRYAVSGATRAFLLMLQ